MKHESGIQWYTTVDDMPPNYRYPTVQLWTAVVQLVIRQDTASTKNEYERRIVLFSRCEENEIREHSVLRFQRYSRHWQLIILPARIIFISKPSPRFELDHYEYNGSKEYLSVGFISFSKFVFRVKIERHLVA